MTVLLECENLAVTFDIDQGQINAVQDLSLTLSSGECLGVVGESGSGKSQSFLAMLGLLARNGRASGSVKFRGEEILAANRRRLNELRGSRLAIIFQDALSGLTPTMRVGEQLAEALRCHEAVDSAQARARAIEMMEIVNIPDAANRFSAYPFELSGGQRQRIMIAMAMICRPDVVIADEPTTALDVTVQAQILRLLDGFRRHTETALVMITHDLAVVAGLCDRVMIMYAGRPVEMAPTATLFDRPCHPYTIGLLKSMPTLRNDPAADLPVIAGQPPDMRKPPPGCAFAERCALAEERCREERPQLRQVGGSQQVACHLVSA